VPAKPATLAPVRSVGQIRYYPALVEPEADAHMNDLTSEQIGDHLLRDLRTDAPELLESVSTAYWTTKNMIKRIRSFQQLRFCPEKPISARSVQSGDDRWQPGCD
jgi:hypothetical protein